MDSPARVSRVLYLTYKLFTVLTVSSFGTFSLIVLFQSVAGVVKSSSEDIARCAGFGPQKVNVIYVNHFEYVFCSL